MLNKLKDFSDRHHIAIVWSLRIILGAVFVVSGLSKSIDVSGFVFKMQEYLDVWSLDVPLPLITVAAIILSGAEFVIGMMLMLGAYRRASVWLLLLMMAVMLPLTAYIWAANPVSDCGCFGDFVKLPNGATFWKNVVITVGLILLLPRNPKVKGVYHAYTQWLAAVASSLYVLAVALYGLNIQPLVDFRSFPVGSRIVADTDDQDDSEYEFIYAKNGNEQTFTLDNLPDSTWSFVNRRQIGGEKERSDATELNIYDENGDNVTQEAIATEGEQLLIVIPQAEKANISGTYAINELQRYLADKDASVVELIATDSDSLDAWRDKSMASLPIYLAEETTLKELSRGDISAVFVRDGVILWKRTLPTIDVDLVTSGAISLDDYETDGRMTLALMTLVFLSMLVIVYMIDASRKFIAWREKKRLDKRKKSNLI